MPPKAAAKAKPKAKGKAKAKAGAKAAPKRAARLRLGLRRPAVAGSRRRAAGIAPDGGGAEELKLEDLDSGKLLEGHLLIFEGEYWEGAVKVSGRGLNLSQGEGGKYLKIKAEGTTSDSVLKYLSGQENKTLRVHLCGKGCTHRLWQDDLIHLTKLSRWNKEAEDWMTNLNEVVPRREDPGGADELGLLRREAELEERKEEKKKKKEKRSRTRSAKRKEKKRRSSSRDKEEKKRSIKIRAKKRITDVLGDTGLDPDPEYRKRLVRRARKIADGKKKKKKKKKKEGGSGSAGSGSQSGEASDSSSTHEEGRGVSREELFGATSTAKKISQQYPGVLGAAWLQEAQDYLMDNQGQVWSQKEGEVPPLAVNYFRNVLQGRMTGPMAREYATIAYMVDLMIQGRVAESVDLGVQRLKSLMSSNAGIHFTVSQKLELLPPDRTQAASLEETQEAAKAAREEEKILSRASQNPRWKTQGPAEQNKGGKGKDGKGKKGKGKDGKSKDPNQNNKGDTKA